MSRATCHMLSVTCHNIYIYIYIYTYIVSSSFLLSFRQSGGANQLRVCYQRGLARLVCVTTLFNRPGVAGAALQTPLSLIH